MQSSNRPGKVDKKRKADDGDVEGDDAEEEGVPQTQRGSFNEDDAAAESGKQKGGGKVVKLRVGPPKAKKARDAMYVNTDAVEVEEEEDDGSEPVELCEVRLPMRVCNIERPHF